MNTSSKIEESVVEVKKSVNKFFSNHSGYSLKTWNEEKNKWLVLYTPCDMVGNSSATWSLYDIKQIYKNKKAHGQIISGMCGHSRVWETCSPSIDDIALVHEKKRYCLSTITIS